MEQKHISRHLIFSNTHVICVQNTLVQTVFTFNMHIISILSLLEYQRADSVSNKPPHVLVMLLAHKLYTETALGRRCPWEIRALHHPLIHRKGLCIYIQWLFHMRILQLFKKKTNAKYKQNSAGAGSGCHLNTRILQVYVGSTFCSRQVLFLMCLILFFRLLLYFDECKSLHPP